MKKGDHIDVLVHDLAFGGEAVGKMIEDGKPGEYIIFIDGATLPGETVTVALDKIKKNFAHGRLVSVKAPASERITPRCKHFGVCGGCSLQHMPYEVQLKWKEKMVRDALEKIGGLQNLEIAPIIGCATPWFYRNKMEYSIDSDRDGKVVIGLHPKKSFREVFDLQECFLESELSVRIAKRVEQWANEKKISSYHFGRNAGLLRNLAVREGKNTGEVLVNLMTNGDDFPKETELVEIFKKEFPEVTTFYRTSIIVKKGFRTAMNEKLLYGKPALTETLTVQTKNGLQKLTFDILPQAFFQPNSLQAQKLYETVLNFGSGEKVMDLFCGTGTIGMFFAKTGSQVLGVDLNESAIINARENASANGLKNIEFVAKDVNKFFDGPASSPHTPNPIPYTLLVTDPPRNGIDPKPLEAILKMRIPHWVYVSCNPTTLARDLKIATEAGYVIEKVQPVDMFPQTYHVETVVKLAIAAQPMSSE